MTVSICHSSTPERLLNSKFDTTKINGQDVLFGLINSDRLPFPHDNNNYDDHVLVEKIAFSCNYRDKSIINLFTRTLSANSKEGNYYYSGFGSDFVGRVIELGKNVKTLQVGGLVIPDATFPVKENGLMGGIPTNYASQKYELIHHTRLMSVPDSMSIEVAASFTVAAQTVYAMLRRLEIRSGMNILITAASSNTSLFAIQVLKTMNVNLFVATTSDVFLKKSKDWGLTTLFNITTLNLQKKHISANFSGFDAIIDPFFDVYFSKVYRLIKNGGKYITCGLHKQHERITTEDHQANVSLHEAMIYCIRNNVSILGNCLGNKQDLSDALNDYNNNKYTVIIDSVFTGNTAGEFINRSFNARERFGKVVYKY